MYFTQQGVWSTTNTMTLATGRFPLRVMIEKHRYFDRTLIRLGYVYDVTPKVITEVSG